MIAGGSGASGPALPKFGRLSAGRRASRGPNCRHSDPRGPVCPQALGRGRPAGKTRTIAGRRTRSGRQSGGRRVTPSAKKNAHRRGAGWVQRAPSRFSSLSSHEHRHPRPFDGLRVHLGQALVLSLNRASRGRRSSGATGVSANTPASSSANMAATWTTSSRATAAAAIRSRTSFGRKKRSTPSRPTGSRTNPPCASCASPRRRNRSRSPPRSVGRGTPTGGTSSTPDFNAAPASCRPFRRCRLESGATSAPPPNSSFPSPSDASPNGFHSPTHTALVCPHAGHACASRHRRARA
jgi:hypothetical protein